MKIKVLLILSLALNLKSFAQMNMDSVIGKWQIDSVVNWVGQDAKDKNARQRMNKLVKKMAKDQIGILGNKQFFFISGIAGVDIKKGKWRLNQELDWLEIANPTAKDFTAMMLRIYKIEEEYFIEIGEVLTANIHRIIK